MTLIEQFVRGGFGAAVLLLGAGAKGHSPRSLSRLAQLISQRLPCVRLGRLCFSVEMGLDPCARLASLSWRIAEDHHNLCFLNLNCKAVRFHPELNLFSGVCVSLGLFVWLAWVF